MGCSTSCRRPTAARCGSSPAWDRSSTSMAGIDSSSQRASHSPVVSWGASSSTRRVQLGDVVDAGVVVGEAGVVGQVGPAGDREEPPPVAVVVGKDAGPAVGGAERPAERRQQAVVAEVADGRLEGVAPLVVEQVEGDHRLQHRHLDDLALAGAQPVHQGGQHRLGDRHPAHLVGDDRGQVAGLAGHLAHQPGQARAGLDGVVVGGPTGVGPLGAEAVGHAVDQPGVLRPARCRGRGPGARGPSGACW